MDIGMKNRLEPQLVFLILDIVVHAMLNIREDWYTECYLRNKLETGYFGEIEVLEKVRKILNEANRKSKKKAEPARQLAASSSRGKYCYPVESLLFFISSSCSSSYLILNEKIRE